MTRPPRRTLHRQDSLAKQLAGVDARAEARAAEAAALQPDIARLRAAIAEVEAAVFGGFCQRMGVATPEEWRRLHLTRLPEIDRERKRLKTAVDNLARSKPRAPLLSLPAASLSRRTTNASLFDESRRSRFLSRSVSKRRTRARASSARRKRRRRPRTRRAEKLSMRRHSARCSLSRCSASGDRDTPRNSSPRRCAAIFRLQVAACEAKLAKTVEDIDKCKAEAQARTRTRRAH